MATRNVEKLSDNDFTKRIVSRNASVGLSSRMNYYCRSSEGIPFNWETLPGTPKDPPREENVPPLSPPPAILSLRLPKPCINVQEPKPSLLFKLKFWRYLRNKKHLFRSKTGSHNKDDGSDRDRDVISKFGSERYLGFESCRSSWSSSRDSFSCHESAKPSNERILTKDVERDLYGCGPWSFRTHPVRVRVSNRD